MRRRWFRIGDGGRWHLIVVRDRNGRRLYGAACGPVHLRWTGFSARHIRSVRSTWPSDPCLRCERAYYQWPRSMPRPLNVRRTVCGRGCGGWIPREAIAGEPVPCGGYHRNKRLFCEADAKWAITANRLFHGGPLPIRCDEPHTTFFRCTHCAAIYRMDPEWFTAERLMGAPPKELVA